MIQAYRELIHRNMKSFRYGLDNPQIRLVQEKIFDILRLQSRLFQSLMYGCRNRGHRKFIDLLAVHMHIIRFVSGCHQRVVIPSAAADQRASPDTVEALIEA